MSRSKIFIAILFCLLLIPHGSDKALAQDDTEVKSISIGFSNPQDALEQAKMLLSPQGKVVFNRNNSTLVVVDYPKNIAAIEKMFSEQASPVNVRIEVRFKDMTERGRSIMGLGIGGSTRGTYGKQHITTVSGGTAYINVGEEVPEPYWFYEYGLQYGYIVQGVVWRDVGTRLIVQPRVSGNLVMVSLTPEISYFDGRRRRSIQYRSASTTVTCYSGQSIEIGGANQSNDFDNHFYRRGKNQYFSLVLTPYILNRSER